MIIALILLLTSVMRRKEGRKGIFFNYLESQIVALRHWEMDVTRFDSGTGILSQE